MDLGQLFSLQDRVAIITGGTGVLGGAMARGLAAAGAKLGILGLSWLLTPSAHVFTLKYCRMRLVATTGQSSKSGRSIQGILTLERAGGCRK